MILRKNKNLTTCIWRDYLASKFFIYTQPTLLPLLNTKSKPKMVYHIPTPTFDLFFNSRFLQYQHKILPLHYYKPTLISFMEFFYLTCAPHQKFNNEAITLTFTLFT